MYELWSKYSNSGRPERLISVHNAKEDAIEKLEEISQGNWLIEADYRIVFVPKGMESTYRDERGFVYLNDLPCEGEPLTEEIVEEIFSDVKTADFYNVEVQEISGEKYREITRHASVPKLPCPKSDRKDGLFYKAARWGGKPAIAHQNKDGYYVLYLPA